MYCATSLRICRMTLLKVKVNSFNVFLKELAALLASVSCDCAPANMDPDFENLTSLLDKDKL